MQNLSITNIISSIDIILINIIDWFRTIFLFICSNKLLFFSILLPISIIIISKAIKLIKNQYIWFRMERNYIKSKKMDEIYKKTHTAEEYEKYMLKKY